MLSVYSAAPADWATGCSSFTSLQRCSRCILQLQSTEPHVGEVLPFCRDAVGVFCSPSRLGRTLIVSCYFQDILCKGRGLPLCKDAVGVFLQPQPTGLSLRDVLPLCRDVSRCILLLQSTEPYVGGVLPFCRDAVGVFCSPSRLGHTLIVSCYFQDILCKGRGLPLCWDVVGVFYSSSILDLYWRRIVTIIVVV